MFLLLPLAASIITGNASAESIVNNQVSGTARVQTHITTSVNGKTTTVESDKPGTIEVTATDRSVDIKTSSGVTSTIASPHVLATISAQPKRMTSWVSFFETLWTKLLRKFGIGS